MTYKLDISRNAIAGMVSDREDRLVNLREDQISYVHCNSHEYTHIAEKPDCSEGRSERRMVKSESIADSLKNIPEK